MRALKEVLVVSKYGTTRLWVCWMDGAWSEFDVIGRLLNAYPPLADGQELVDWAVSVAQFGKQGSAE